tara:strand:- start:380 stop:1075 length:696 start_codon:yes stop_codon:yes gene_type:complete
MVMSEENKEQLSPLYYFYSQGCGFCKKSEPIIDELNKEGHDILKLDLADKDNAAINKELKEKYKAQCGTPWFINADTGHQICGYREKDIVEKWVKGEEIPEPPRPKGPPPPPPQDMENKDQVEEWKTKYEAWVKENDHMPNLPPSDQMLQRIKQQKKMMEQRQAQQNGNLEVRISIMEQKLDRLLNHLGVKTNDIKPPVQKPPVINNPPRKVPAPPASKKPAKKKRAKGGK